MKEAEGTLQEALSIYRDLAKANPLVYQPSIVRTLDALAFLHFTAGEVMLGVQENQEAI